MQSPLSYDDARLSTMVLHPITPALLLAVLLTGCICCKVKDAVPGTNAASSDGSRLLFDGRSLAGWMESDFAGKGEVRVEDGTLVLGSGFMTGLTYTNGHLPATNYELSLEAMRVDGTDFFCGLTFPVADSSCSFIVGGWGGGVVGLSSIDSEDAANNDTTRYMNFQSGRWYALRVRVTPGNISAWIDGEQVVDQDIANHTVSIRIEMEACVPLGVATYSTTGALRNFKLSPL